MGQQITNDDLVLSGDNANKTNFVGKANTVQQLPLLWCLFPFKPHLEPRPNRINVFNRLHIFIIWYNELRTACPKIDTVIRQGKYSERDSENELIDKDKAV